MVRNNRNCYGGLGLVKTRNETMTFTEIGDFLVAMIFVGVATGLYLRVISRNGR